MQTFPRLVRVGVVALALAVPAAFIAGNVDGRADHSAPESVSGLRLSGDCVVTDQLSAKSGDDSRVRCEHPHSEVVESLSLQVRDPATGGWQTVAAPARGSAAAGKSLALSVNMTKALGSACQPSSTYRLLSRTSTVDRRGGRTYTGNVAAATSRPVAGIC